jgi:hypothetical protein
MPSAVGCKDTGKDVHCTGLVRSEGLQEVKAPRIFRHWALEGGKVVSPTHLPPLLPEKILISVRV